MKRANLPLGVFSAFAMLLMILDSKTALLGAQEGLALCLRTVIPSLFPFFVLSRILTGALMGAELSFLRPLTRFCGIPVGGEALLLTGFLGGYPVGASALADAYGRGELTQAQACRLLTFCNNAGPAFVFGMASALFPSAWMPWMLWSIHIVSALIVSRLFPTLERGSITRRTENAPTLSGAVAGSVRTLGLVCGWVVLFRIVIAFFSRWFSAFFNENFLVLLYGMLELSNGCCTLTTVESIPLRFLFCSAMLGFGGLCVLAQTASVTKELGIRWYLLGKLLQMAISIYLSCLLFFPSMLLLLPVGLFCIVFSRKSSRFSARAGV